MPRRGLSSRLKQLRGVRGLRSLPAASSPQGPAVQIPGFLREGEFVCSRREVIPGVPLPGPRSGLLLPPETADSELLFFDLETTGLSGGAGTVAFLAGFGTWGDGGFQLDQYLLLDYPGEPEFLRLLQSRMAGKSHLVSYNGRAFDANLLATRGLMNGLRLVFPRHLDLLFPSRRLWRAEIGSCSLGNIESTILNIHRSGDIPGSEVPERWFAFLRDGDPRPLQPVFSHHRQDIVSLALLLARLEGILNDPGRAHGIDRRSAGLFLLSRGDRRGEALIEAAWQAGDPRAGTLLALLCKRRGDWSRALAIWERIASGGGYPGVCEELAKYHEHKSRRWDEALRRAEEGLELLRTQEGSPRRREEFRRRIVRLRGKLHAQI
jgi:uncharacterized protein